MAKYGHKLPYLAMILKISRSDSQIWQFRPNMANIGILMANIGHACFSSFEMAVCGHRLPYLAINGRIWPFTINYMAIFRHFGTINNLDKKCLTKYGQYWPSVRAIWPNMAITPGHISKKKIFFWPSMAKYGHIYKNMAIFGYKWPNPAMGGNNWIFIAKYGKNVINMAIFGHGLRGKKNHI